MSALLIMSVVEYAVTYRQDILAPGGESCIVAEHPELPGCFGFGATEREARATLDEAREAYLSVARRKGIPVPSPRLLLEAFDERSRHITADSPESITVRSTLYQFRPTPTIRTRTGQT